MFWPDDNTEWERINSEMEEHMERTSADFQKSISSISSKLKMLEGQANSAFRDPNSRVTGRLQADSNGNPPRSRRAEEEPAVHGDQQAWMDAPKAFAMPLHRFLSPVPQPDEETAPAEVAQDLAQGERLVAEGRSRATTHALSSHVQLPAFTHSVDTESNEALGSGSRASSTIIWPDAGFHGQSDGVATLALGHRGLPLAPGATGSPSSPVLRTGLPLNAGERASRFHLHAVMRRPAPRSLSASCSYCISTKSDLRAWIQTVLCLRNKTLNM